MNLYFEDAFSWYTTHYCSDWSLSSPTFIWIMCPTICQRYSDPGVSFREFCFRARFGHGLLNPFVSLSPVSCAGNRLLPCSSSEMHHTWIYHITKWSISELLDDNQTLMLLKCHINKVSVTPHLSHRWQELGSISYQSIRQGVWIGETSPFGSKWYDGIIGSIHKCSKV